MVLRWLPRAIAFPPADSADREGVVAIGGDVSPERLLLAYRSGIFPWPMSEEYPLFWFSPNPRYVIEPTRAHLPKSLRKQCRREVFDVRVDTDFLGVIDGCAAVPRPGQKGTWITPEMRQGYARLHALGYAHSIEAYEADVLVGGLYGVSLGGVFFGESMFARAPDASKVAFATLLGHLVHWGFGLVDCQTRTDHLERFGAVGWPRKTFLAEVARLVEVPTKMGPWRFEMDPGAACEKVPG